MRKVLQPWQILSNQHGNPRLLVDVAKQFLTDAIKVLGDVPGLLSMNMIRFIFP